MPVGATSRRSLTAVSLLGGGLGAGLLLVLPAASFDAVVPWLLGFATLVLAFGRRLSERLAAVLGRPVGLSARAILAAQFVLAIYGGYFGGAVGILMLALWSVGLGLDTAVGNPMRVTQLTAVWSVAAVLFLLAADVLRDPLPVAAVLVGAAAGGMAGARWARRLPARLLRGDRAGHGRRDDRAVHPARLTPRRSRLGAQQAAERLAGRRGGHGFDELDCA